MGIHRQLRSSVLSRRVKFFLLLLAGVTGSSPEFGSGDYRFESCAGSAGRSGQEGWSIPSIARWTLRLDVASTLKPDLPGF